MSIYNVLSAEAASFPLTASATPVAAQLPFVDEFLFVYNAGTTIAYVNPGTLSTTTATVNDCPIPPGFGMTIRMPRYNLPVGQFPWLAAYSTATAALTIAVAQGL